MPIAPSVSRFKLMTFELLMSMADPAEYASGALTIEL